ncbi:hypothetical protein Bbelb_083170 [Branchiostoma belcheri]|nr:hypothetical protein Bbelb_083170 [Branchiostoma belcheri]
MFQRTRRESTKIASRYIRAAILDIVGNVRYRRRERSVAPRLPKRDRKLSDHNRKAYRAFPTAVADIPDYIQNGGADGSSGQQKTGSKTEHRAANGKCAVLPMDLSTTLAEGNAMIQVDCELAVTFDPPMSYVIIDKHVHTRPRQDMNCDT